MLSTLKDVRDVLDDDTLTDEDKTKMIKVIYKKVPQYIFNKSTNPFRIIRITKDISGIEFAKSFECSPAYISQLERELRATNNVSFLKKGFDKHDIPIELYFILKEIGYQLKDTDYSDNTKYRIMIAKSLGELNPELKEQSMAMLSKYYSELDLNNELYSVKTK
jgi:transcriptional regulator with XRE-family HTH domain